MHREFLQEAIQLSLNKMQANEGGPFGAVVVRHNEVVGRGWNRVTSTQDPSAHAEMVAIRESCARLGTFSLQGCDLYTSCEPCPMCLGAIYWSRLDRVFYAATREDAAWAGFDDQRLYEEMTLPWEKRSLPGIQALREEAVAVLEHWRNKEDRHLY